MKNVIKKKILAYYFCFLCVYKVRWCHIYQSFCFVLCQFKDGRHCQTNIGHIFFIMVSICIMFFVCLNNFVYCNVGSTRLTYSCVLCSCGTIALSRLFFFVESKIKRPSRATVPQLCFMQATSFMTVVKFIIKIQLLNIVFF